MYDDAQAMSRFEVSTGWLSRKSEISIGIKMKRVKNATVPWYLKFCHLSDNSEEY